MSSKIHKHGDHAGEFVFLLPEWRNGDAVESLSALIQVQVLSLVQSVVPVRKEMFELRLKDTVYSRQPTTLRNSHPQNSQVAEW